MTVEVGVCRWRWECDGGGRECDGRDGQGDGGGGSVTVEMGSVMVKVGTVRKGSVRMKKRRVEIVKINGWTTEGGVFPNVSYRQKAVCDRQVF